MTQPALMPELEVNLPAEFRRHTVQTPTPEGFMDLPGVEDGISLTDAMQMAQRYTSNKEGPAKYTILRVVDCSTGWIVAVYTAGTLLSGASRERLIELERREVANAGV